MIKTEAAKKSIYEYTKVGSDHTNQLRKDTFVMNRESNIQWGLKVEVPAMQTPARYSHGPNKPLN